MEKTNEGEQGKVPSNLMGITYVWIGVIIGISLNMLQAEKGNFNEWGDFFAGFFAPIVFLWIGYGVYTQRQEFGKLAESVKNHSVQSEKQSCYMDDQLSNDKSQDILNWYSRCSDTLKKLSQISDKKTIELYKDFINPTEINTYEIHISKLNQLLSYNQHVNNSFLEQRSDFSETGVLIKEDYQYLHGEDIKFSKGLYLKMSIVYMFVDTLNINIVIPESFKVLYNDQFKTDITSEVETLKSEGTLSNTEIALSVFKNFTSNETIYEYFDFKEE